MSQSRAKRSTTRICTAKSAAQRRVQASPGPREEGRGGSGEADEVGAEERQCHAAPDGDPRAAAERDAEDRDEQHVVRRQERRDPGRGPLDAELLRELRGEHADAAQRPADQRTPRPPGSNPRSAHLIPHPGHEAVPRENAPQEERARHEVAIAVDGKGAEVIGPQLLGNERSPPDQRAEEKLNHSRRAASRVAPCSTPR